MDHRCSSRKPLMLDVVIGYSAIGLVQGRTRDVGLGGMFVEMKCVALPVNAMVQASLILDKNGRKESCQTRAMVVHSQSAGVGLMFHELDVGLCEALRTTLRELAADAPDSCPPPLY